MAIYKSFVNTMKAADWMHVENEDSVFMTRFSLMNDSYISIFAVADGMGGLQNGKKTSDLCIRTFFKSMYSQVLDLYDPSEKNFTIAHYFDRLKEAVTQAFVLANREVSRAAAPGTETGTTLSTAVLLGDSLLISNVGDSPVLFYDGRSHKAYFISELQTLAEKEARLGKYERFSESYFSRDYVITHYIGEYNNLQKSVISHKLIRQVKAGDRLLIASDGAIGKMLPDEVFRVLGQGIGPTALARLFQRASVDRDDDRTGIFVEFV